MKICQTIVSTDAVWEAHNQKIIDCLLCPRLVAYREQRAREKRRAYLDCTYWGRPVPGFGDIRASLLVVGLAPGAHGSNRTGRMFTGDASGIFLYSALYRAGFANQPLSLDSSDGLQLQDIFITSVGRCAPPANKPTLDELKNCRPFLLAELAQLDRVKGIVLLGRVAFEQVVDIIYPKNRSIRTPTFSHGSLVNPGNGAPWLLASYHPSRQNTQTGRLTVDMFDQIWSKARALLEKAEALTK